jgi:hypothetical protein
MEGSISNELKDQELANVHVREDRKELLRQNRCQMLDSMRFGNGFDVVTGAVKSAVVAAEKPRGKRRFTGGVSAESVHRGMGLLRESEGRFHMPHNSGNYAEKRQHVLVK